MFLEEMKNLVEECREELNSIGIYPSSRIKDVRINKRAKKRLGCCRRENGLLGEVYIIELSHRIEGADKSFQKEIVIHELLHTCKGCFNHGTKWKSYAKEVKEKLGYHITVGVKTDRLADSEIEIKAPKYKITCKNCGITSYRYRSSKVIQFPEKYRCKNCGGNLEVAKL